MSRKNTGNILLLISMEKLIVTGNVSESIPNLIGWQVALLLIRHGADVDVEDKEGYTVLGRASKDLRPVLIDAAKAMLEDWIFM